MRTKFLPRLFSIVIRHGIHRLSRRLCTNRPTALSLYLPGSSSAPNRSLAVGLVRPLPGTRSSIPVAVWISSVTYDGRRVSASRAVGRKPSSPSPLTLYCGPGSFCIDVCARVLSKPLAVKIRRYVAYTVLCSRRHILSRLPSGVLLATLA